MRLLVLLVLASTLSGCPAKDAVRVKGNTLFFPVAATKEQAAMYARSGKDPRKFVKFDGKYPPSWPVKIGLPDPFYSQYGEPLVASLSRNSDPAFANLQIIKFKGVAKSTPEELIEFFRKQLIEAGWTITKDSPSGPLNEMDGSVVPGSQTLIASPPGSSLDQLFVGIDLKQYANGWAWCAGSYRSE